MVRLYAAMERELLVVTGGDGRWAMEAPLRDVQVQCVAADPLRPERVYCGTFDRGLWRSRDAGATWERVGEGVVGSAVTAVAVSTQERAGGSGVAYAGTEPSALFRSDDGGETWQERPALKELPSSFTWSFPPRPYTHHVRWITPDPDAAGQLYVCIEAGALVRSADGGETWQDRTPDGPYDTHTLAAHRLAPGRLYAAAGDGFMAPGNGFAQSHDGGATWQRDGAGLRHHYLWSVAVDPADPDTIVVSGAHGPQQAHNPTNPTSAVYRKAAGQPWQEVQGLPAWQGTIVADLAAHEAEPGVFYAASNKGLFRSSDAGLTWQRLAVPWPEDRFRYQHARGLVAAG